jgi:uncharacterized membrane protein YwzB
MDWLEFSVRIVLTVFFVNVIWALQSLRAKKKPREGRDGGGPE